MTCDLLPSDATWCLAPVSRWPGALRVSSHHKVPPISDQPSTNHRLRLATGRSVPGASGCYCYISCEPVISVLTFSNKIDYGSGLYLESQHWISDEITRGWRITTSMSSIRSSRSLGGFGAELGGRRTGRWGTCRGAPTAATATACTQPTPT